MTKNKNISILFQIYFFLDIEERINNEQQQQQKNRKKNEGV